MESLQDFREVIVTIGGAGLLAVIVLRLVFDFLKGRKNQESEPGADARIEKRLSVIDSRLIVIAQHTNDLHVWHAPDNNGEQIWRNKQMLALMNKLVEEERLTRAAIIQNTNVIERLVTVLDRMDKGRSV